MIDETDFTPIIGKKLTGIKMSGSQLVLKFSNKRTFTIILELHVGDHSIEPKARLFCGYYDKKKEK